MGFQKVLNFFIILSILLSFSAAEGATKKKKAPAKKTEGYYLAVRYLASDHKQFPKPSQKTKKRLKKKTSTNQKKNKSKRS